MNNIRCKNCGNEISEQASACPKCGQPNQQSKTLSSGHILLVILLGVGFFLLIYNGFTPSQSIEDRIKVNAAKELDRIKNSVADDMVRQYDIAKRQGDAMQICVQAGFVSAAYLQAKDEVNYQRWKQTEKADCRHAGIR